MSCFQSFISKICCKCDNTIVTDLRKLRLALEAKNVSIDYSRKTGFVLVGEEMIIREVGYQYLVYL